MINFTDKQKEFHQLATKTWNIKIGAVRSGKTYMDFLFEIPHQARRLKDKEGLFVIMGVTQSTIERNILEPMRNIYGDRMVRNIMQGQSTVRLFGQLFHVVGHEKISAVSRIQGSSIKYCYIDEGVEMNKEVFEMMKSRLDKPYSRCTMTGNPDQPSHFIKEFIDEEINNGDMFYQHYTIDDNPMLDSAYVARLKREYAGTVYYKRYILGQWARAEGAIYPTFSDKNIIKTELWNLKDNSGRYTHHIRSIGGFINIGVDFGGNQSAHAFNATFVTNGYEYIVTIKDRRIKRELTPSQLDDEFVQFIQEIVDEGYLINEIRADNAEPVLIRGIQSALTKSGLYYTVRKARKRQITERIRAYQRLLNLDRYLLLSRCEDTIGALENAVWSDKVDADGRDIRLDDGTSNIDNLDAQEYSTEMIHKQLLREADYDN